MDAVPVYERTSRSRYLKRFLLFGLADALNLQISWIGTDKRISIQDCEERVDVGFEDQWIDNSSMADRDPTLTVDKNGQSR
jgi:hypothetical protein